MTLIKNNLGYIVGFVTTTVLAVVALPMVVSAQAPNQLGNIGGLFGEINDFVSNVLVPLVFAVAFLVFIWGVFQYFILGGGDEDKRAQGRGLMIWGIVGFVLFIAVWGIVNLIATGFGFDNDNTIEIPDIPGAGGDDGGA